MLDVRWRLDRPEGRPEYLDGHLPGAVYVDLDRELARKGEPAEGRHPLPTRETLQDAARRWGLRDGDIVVAYDDVQSVAAARAWWLLDAQRASPMCACSTAACAPGSPQGCRSRRAMCCRRAGDVVLAELAAGSRRSTMPQRGRRTACCWTCARPSATGARSSRIDPVAGHVPGAINLPTTTAPRTAAGSAMPAAIRARSPRRASRAATPVAAYCGSGITAAHTALAGALAGIDVAVFPGSWSQWSNTRGPARRDRARRPSASVGRA